MWAWHCNQISGHCLEEATQSSPGPEIEIDETSMQFIDASSRMPPDMEGGRGGGDMVRDIWRYMAHSLTALSALWVSNRMC